MKSLNHYRQAYINKAIEEAAIRASATALDDILADVMDDLVLERRAWIKKRGMLTEGASHNGPWKEYFLTQNDVPIIYWERMWSPFYQGKIQIGDEEHCFDPRGRPYYRIYDADYEVRIKRMSEIIELLEKITPE